MPRAPRHAAANETESTDVIVISGVLLLVAVVFLVIGLFGSLAWVYASIGVSVASFLFLLIGVRQRRDPEPAPAPATGAAPSPAPASPASPSPATSRDRDEEVTVVASQPGAADPE